MHLKCKCVAVRFELSFQNNSVLDVGTEENGGFIGREGMLRVGSDGAACFILSSF